MALTPQKIYTVGALIGQVALPLGALGRRGSTPSKQTRTNKTLLS